MNCAQPVVEHDDEESPVPGYKNYIIYTDESGIHGGPYYGFGSLWIPWERRGDLQQQFRELRERYDNNHELKWNKVTDFSEPFACDVVRWFFQKSWIMFHCIVLKRSSIDAKLHQCRDQAQQKHFSMLLKNKIAYFASGGGKLYRIRVDPLPWRYKKSDQVVHKVVNAQLKKEIGHSLIHDVIARDSKQTVGIQIADVLLGAVLAAWQKEAAAKAKIAVMREIAEHLGWPELHHDTERSVWKFNVWHFHDPKCGKPREAVTLPVKLKYPMPAFRRRK